MSLFLTVPSKYHGTQWEDQYPNVPNNIITANVFWGGVALPTLTGDGVIVQHNRNLYQLSCDASTCNWERLEKKELPFQIKNGVAMILPEEYTCE